MNDHRLEQFLKLSTEQAMSPPETFGGVISDTGGMVAKYSEVAGAVVGKLRVAGLSLFDIARIVGLIGYFFKEHGDDIDAIVKAILALFGK